MLTVLFDTPGLTLPLSVLLGCCLSRMNGAKVPSSMCVIGRSPIYGSSCSMWDAERPIDAWSLNSTRNRVAACARFAPGARRRSFPVVAFPADESGTARLLPFRLLQCFPEVGYLGRLCRCAKSRSSGRGPTSFFAPLFCSLAPTAGQIVVLIGLLFNCHGLSPGICPLIQFEPVEANALFPNGEFADVRSNGLVKFFPAHAQVRGGS
ncbi:hypothetical protein QMY54_02610 [Pseudomonas rhodesiae]|nr:hypothetical protein QMY54_02610 [Pseudomonas rhodesiae]